MHSPLRFALLGLFSTSAVAHMTLGEPVPYGKATLDNSPLSATGSDYPCKQRSGVYDITQENTYTVGQDNPLNFVGSAVHGGGSCQISLTTDREPTAKSSFKVIASYIGGCPGTDGGPANFTFKIPDSIPDGKYALAWTWFNRIGNREMYMNCAAATVTGSPAKDASGMQKLPDMMVANIGNGCSDTESTDPDFPNPGDVVVKGADAKPAPFTGSCAGGTGGSSSSGSTAGASSAAGSAPASSATGSASSSGGDGSSSGADNTGQCTGSCLGGGSAGGSSGAGSGAASSAAATTAAAATSAASSVPAGGAASAPPAGGASSGGVFAPGASSAAATSAPAASAAPNSTSTFTTMQTVTGSPAAPSASASAAPSAPAPAAPAGTGTAGGSTSASCTDGAIVCNGTDQFALCNHGQVQWMPVAAGTQCQNGQITKRDTGEVVKRGAPHRARRSL